MHRYKLRNENKMEFIWIFWLGVHSMCMCDDYFVAVEVILEKKQRHYIQSNGEVCARTLADTTGRSSQSSFIIAFVFSFSNLCGLGFKFLVCCVFSIYERSFLVYLCPFKSSILTLTVFSNLDSLFHDFFCSWLIQGDRLCALQQGWWQVSCFLV